MEKEVIVWMIVLFCMPAMVLAECAGDESDYDDPICFSQMLENNPEAVNWAVVSPSQLRTIVDPNAIPPDVLIDRAGELSPDQKAKLDSDSLASGTPPVITKITDLSELDKDQMKAALEKIGIKISGESDLSGCMVGTDFGSGEPNGKIVCGAGDEIIDCGYYNNRGEDCDIKREGSDVLINGHRFSGFDSLAMNPDGTFSVYGQGVVDGVTMRNGQVEFTLTEGIVEVIEAEYLNDASGEAYDVDTRMAISEDKFSEITGYINSLLADGVSIEEALVDLEFILGESGIDQAHIDCALESLKEQIMIDISVSYTHLTLPTN